MTEIYYLVGLRKKEGRMIPVVDLTGDDNILSPLSTTEDETEKCQTKMTELYPNEDHCCLKAIILRGGKE